MVRFMKENGKMDLKKGKESGREYLVIHIQENGLKAKPMDTAFTFGKMEIGMKENGKCA